MLRDWIEYKLLVPRCWRFYVEFFISIDEGPETINNFYTFGSFLKVIMDVDFWEFSNMQWSIISRFYELINIIYRV